MTTEPSEKAEALASEYESVFTKEDLLNIPHILPSPYSEMDNFAIDVNGVKAQLENLNVHKSVGPDGLSPHILKMLSSDISPFLTGIFQQSLTIGKCPEDWKIQHISPILKPGKKKTIANSLD